MWELKHWLHSFTILKLLMLQGIIFVSDRGLWALSLGCIHLKELIVSDCPFISDKGLQFVASQCLELTSLAVNGTKVSSFGIRNFLVPVNYFFSWKSIMFLGKDWFYLGVKVSLQQES